MQYQEAVFAQQIEQAMTPAERASFLANFTSRNRMWCGAHVADALDHLSNSDAHCGVIDAILEQQGNLTVHPLQLIGMAIRALIYIKNNEAVTWAEVQELTSRVRS